jgi:hypothetical protein
MKKVKVGDRFGVTDEKPMPFGNEYAVWFEGADKVEFVKISNITYLPMNNKTCYQMWRETQSDRGLEI